MPTNVKLAAGFLVAYGVTIVIQALIGQALTDLDDPLGAIRAFGRAALSAFVAWALTRGQRWAWWVAVIAATVFGLAGALGLVTIAALGSSAPPLPARAYFFIGLSVLELGAVAALLLTPTARKAFRRT